MKFLGFKEFRSYFQPGLTETDIISRYLKTDYKKILRDLQLGLTKLSFEDNFQSFEIEVTIGAGAELAIRNEIRDAIPSQRLIVRGGAGSQDIVDGDTEWTRDFVYLKNTGGSSATATVVFIL